MPASSPNRVMRTNHQGRERDRACIRDPRADRVQRPNPTVRDQPEQKWRQYSLTAFSPSAPRPSFSPCWRGALQGLWERKGSRCTPANAAHSPPRRSPAPARARRTLSQLITAHTDAAAQPTPCPTHAQNISSSNLLSFQRKNIRGGGQLRGSTAGVRLG